MRAIVFLALFHCGLTMAYESLLPSISLQRFNAGESGANLMMMAVGGGALVSSVFLAGVRSSSNRGRLFLYFGLLSGGSQLILALSGNIVMATAGAALMGVSQAGFMTITHTIIQTIAPDWVRGRISGVYSIHIGGTMALINLVNGGLADHVEASMLLIIGGVSFIAVMVLSLNYLSMRNIYSRGVPVAQPVAD
jgi:predicted MFS family arabinose efflux permease